MEEEESRPGLDPEILETIRIRIASAVHLAAAARLAQELRCHPAGEEFLRSWAKERRDEADRATVPAASAAMSDLLAAEKREIVEAMLQQLNL